MSITYFKPGTRLTFSSVTGVRERLLKALKADKNAIFCLDLNEVTHCDSAGLALLIEAKRLCKKKNKVFKVIAVPPNTLSLAEFCGVGSLLETAE